MSVKRTRALIGAVLAVENEDGTPTLDGEAVVATTGDMVEVEPLSTEGTEGEATAEVVEGEAEVEEVADEVETMQENVEALEALASDLKAAIKDGGLTPQAAVMFNHAYQAIAGRHLGLKGRTLAAESFGSASQRLRATEAAHESVIDSIKSFIKGIIEFVKKIVAKVVAWFKSVITAKGRLIARLKNLETAVATVGSELKDKSKKIPFPSTLTLGGKAPTADSLTSAMENLVIEAGGFPVDEAFGERVEKIVDEIKSADLAGKIMLTEVTQQEFVKKLIQGKFIMNSNPFDKKALSQSQVGAASKELPGSKVFLVTSANPSVTGVGMTFACIDLKIVDSAEKLKMSEKLETAAWSSGELTGLLNVAMSIASNKKWTADKTVQSVSKGIDSVLTDLIKSADGASDDAEKKVATNARTWATSMQGVMSRLSRGYMQIESFAFQKAQLSANLISAHVKAYK